jgi:hypothetical protein
MRGADEFLCCVAAEKVIPRNFRFVLTSLAGLFLRHNPVKIRRIWVSFLPVLLYGGA